MRKLNSVLDYLEELMANVDNHIKLAKLLFPQGQMWMWGRVCYFLLFKLGSFETFSHSTFLGEWVKSSVTCRFDVIAVFSYWVAVFVVISEVEFSTTLSISLQGSMRADSKKTVLSLLGEKRGTS